MAFIFYVHLIKYKGVISKSFLQNLALGIKSRANIFQ